MPDLLNAVAANPPRVFVIQTRGPLIVRDIDLLRVLAARTTLRVSFSITTDSDSVRRIFEPGCAPISERWQTVAASQSAGIETSVAIAPILPCDPAAIIERAAAATCGPRHGTRQSRFVLATAGTSGWIRRFGARERKGPVVRSRAGRIRIACQRREHSLMPRRLIIEEKL